MAEKKKYKSDTLHMEIPHKLVPIVRRMLREYRETNKLKHQRTLLFKQIKKIDNDLKKDK